MVRNALNASVELRSLVTVDRKVIRNPHVS
jgi:hypothetical protein